MKEKVMMTIPNNQEEHDALWSALDDAFPQGENDATLKDTLPRTIQDIEIRAIRNALEQFDFNRTKTAYALGLGRTNLIAKCRKYDIYLPEVA